MTRLTHEFPAFTYISLKLSLAESHSDLLVRHIALLRDCVALAQHRWPFTIEAASVLPSELHMLVRLPAGDDMNARLRLIRSAFARHSTGADSKILWCREDGQSVVPLSAVESRKRHILDAPVRARLVKFAEDWAYSSLHKRGAPHPVYDVA